jgi:hypothetical protein
MGAISPPPINLSFFGKKLSGFENEITSTSSGILRHFRSKIKHFISTFNKNNFFYLF